MVCGILRSREYKGNGNGSVPQSQQGEKRAKLKVRMQRLEALDMEKIVEE